MSNKSNTAQNEQNLTVVTVSAMLSEGSDLSVLTEAYRSADVSGKAKIRKIVADVRDAAIERLDAVVGKAAIEALKSLKSGSSDKAETDPKEAFAAYVASVQVFAESVMSGSFVPSAFEGIDAEVRLQVIGEVKYESSDSSLVSKFESVRPASTVRRSVGAHLAEVFADLPVGTQLTNTEAANTRSTVYGDDKPSAGAVAAHVLSDSSGLVRSSKKSGERIVSVIEKVA